MKKMIYGVLFLSTFGLTACGSKNEEVNTDNQFESRGKELESSSTSEVENAQSDRSKDEILSDVSSDIDKKIISAFLDAGLKMYSNTVEGVSEGVGEMPTAESDDPSGFPMYDSGMTFYPQKRVGDDDMVISIFNFSDDNTLLYASEWFDEKTIDKEKEDSIKNNNINSILIGNPSTESEKKLFNKYKEVFENIK